MNEISKDYHDYVFRDGKLVGEFEAMYRHSESIPWHQDQQANWADVRLTGELLSDIGPFDEIHDLGCGLGYYLSLIGERVGTGNCQCFGYDISETACIKAKQKFPDFQFMKLDLTAPTSRKPQAASLKRRLFVIRGTLWYVFSKLDHVLKAIRDLMSDGDTLLVVQNFPPLASSFVGKDVLPNHHALIAHFAHAFLPVRHIWYEDSLKSGNDNWFIGLFKTRN
jgi:SAM-dependent methyltransferase